MITKLNALVNRLEERMNDSEMVNPIVSQGSIGWHIQHCLITINMIIEALKRSKADQYQWRFKFTKLMIFTLNKIPRGKIKSPKIVVPKTHDETEIKAYLPKVRAQIVALENLEKNLFFEHPFLGHLKVDETTKFLTIHTRHHLDIINDILKSKK